MTESINLRNIYQLNMRLSQALFPDIGVSCDGDVYPCHKLVLACHSPFLRELVSSLHPMEDSLLILPDFNADDVKHLMQFLYGQQTEDLKGPNMKDLCSVLGLAKDLNAADEVTEPDLFGGYSLQDYQMTEVLVDNNNMLEEEMQSGVNTSLCVFCGKEVAVEVYDDHMKQHPVCSHCNIQCCSEADLMDHWSQSPACGQVMDWSQPTVPDKFPPSDVSASCNLGLSFDNLDFVNDPLIDGRKCSELFQEANPDFVIEKVECGSSIKHETMMTVAEVSMKICSFCQQGFQTEQELVDHTSDVHRDILDMVNGNQLPVNEEQPPLAVSSAAAICQCSLCLTKFDKLTNLTKHVVDVHQLGDPESGNSYQCRSCPGTLFGSLVDLRQHMAKDHPGEDKTVQCPDCGKNFKNWRLLQVHISTHLSVKAFQCTACCKTFSWEPNLRVHLKNCITDQYSASVNKSNKPRRGSKVIAASMNVPAQDFISPDSMSPHYPHQDPIAPHEELVASDLVNDGQVSQGDNLIPSAMIDLNDSAAHKVTQSSIAQEKIIQLSIPEKRVKSKRYTCQCCPTVARSKEEILEHVTRCPHVKAKMLLQQTQMLMGQQGDMMVEPTEDKVYFDMSSLNNNDKERRFECQFCDKKFLTSCHLKEHIMTHTREYPFHCSSCGQGFARVRKLQAHQCPRNKVQSVKEAMESIKMKRKAGYECNLCYQEFEDLTSLDSHMETHSLTSTRSGRTIKPNRRFSEETVQEPDRRPTTRRMTLIAATKIKEDKRCAKVSTQCEECELVLASHMELFRHSMIHLDQDIVKTLPIFEEGDTGWCQFCNEALVLDTAGVEDHMATKHPEMLRPVMGGNTVVVKEERDLETRSVIKAPVEEAAVSHGSDGKCKSIKEEAERSQEIVPEES